jgi:hypothetical protein
MNRLPLQRPWLLPALSGLLLASACSEDPQSFGSGKCPELPLYRWEAQESGSGKDITVTWTRTGVESGQKLTADQERDIVNAEENGCITGAGFATDNAGGATGSGGGGSGGGAADGGP